MLSAVFCAVLFATLHAMLCASGFCEGFQLRRAVELHLLTRRVPCCAILRAMLYCAACHAVRFRPLQRSSAQPMRWSCTS